MEFNRFKPKATFKVYLLIDYLLSLSKEDLEVKLPIHQYTDKTKRDMLKMLKANGREWFLVGKFDTKQESSYKEK